MALVRGSEGTAEVSRGRSRTAGRSEGPNVPTAGRPSDFAGSPRKDNLELVHAKPPLRSLMQTKTKLKAERVGKYMVRPVIALEKVFAPTGSSGAISGAVDSAATGMASDTYVQL